MSEKMTVKIRAMKIEAEGLTPEQVKKLFKAVTKAITPKARDRALKGGRDGK